MKRAWILWLLLLAPERTQAFEAGDYVLGLSLGQHRAGLLLQVFVSDEIALEAFGYSRGFVGAGVIAYPFDHDGVSLVASVTRVAGMRLPSFDDAPGRTFGPHYAIASGAGVDFGHISRRTSLLRGNVGDAFFAALGPTLRLGPLPPRPDRGRLREARRLSPFYQLGLKSFYR